MALTRNRTARAAAALATATCLTITACSSSGGGSGATGGASGSGASPAASGYPSGGDAAFTKKWSALITKAKKEGSLAILDGPNVANGEGPVFQAFGKEYGIKITQIQGAPDQIVSRVLAERQQGIHSVDVAMAGGGATDRMLAAKIFEPLKPELISPEALDRTTGWPSKTIQWNPDDKARNYITTYSRRADANYVEIWYNTSKVTKADLSKMTSWNNLLDPKYKGKIEIGDVANNAASNDRILGWLGLGGSTYWQKFMSETKPKVFPVGSSRDMSDALARGQYDWMLFIDADDPLISAQKDGLPVAQFQQSFTEGHPSSAGGNLSIFDHPAHPATAQLFVNWLLSKQGQTAYNAVNKNADNVAQRTDVPQGGIPDEVWKRATDPKAKFIPLDPAFDAADKASIAWWKSTFNKLKLGTHS